MRELDHVVERAMILARGKSGTLHFDIERDEFEESSWSAPEENASGWPTLAEMENRYIRAVLAKCGGKLTGKTASRRCWASTTPPCAQRIKQARNMPNIAQRENRTRAPEAFPAPFSLTGAEDFTPKGTPRLWSVP